MTHLLQVCDLTTQFKIEGKLIRAVDGVSYHIDAGEIVSIVGESGCGKSASQLSVLQLIPTPPGKIVSGQVLFEGVDLLKFKADSEPMRAVRGGKIGMIFQEPMTSLNPVLTIGQQIAETLMLHLKMDRGTAHTRAIELLGRVGIPDASQRVEHYPHQFSGGMRQRAMIAMAMACQPKLLIADEATTALDVTMQAQLLELLRDTVRQFNTALLIVTHNLGVVARYAQRIYVMYAGRVVESGTAKDIFGNPRHPYTIGLLRSVPRLDEPKGANLIPIPGLPPSLINRPPTCAFLARCAHRTEQCTREPWPLLTKVDDGHFVSCFVDIRAQPTLTVTVRENMTTQAAAPKSENDALVQVNHLKMYFPIMKGILRRQVADVKAVDDVSFHVQPGETLSLVGESGCGKTTTGRCVLRLYRPTDGQIIFAGRDISQLSKNQVRPLRRKMALIFQDPYGSLDPRQTAGNIVGEPLVVHHLVNGKGEYQDRVAQLFKMVGLNPWLSDRVPHEFSGGQRQRIGIARALASDPSFIVCDEPISALDVSIQAQIVNLLKELQAQLGLTYLFIGHDLSVVRHISDRVAVMYLGHIVEEADCSALYENPLHPYTKALLAAVPIPDPFVEERRAATMLLQGEVPSPINPPAGCPFHPRCPLAIRECSQALPPLREINSGHRVACIRA
ncbi:MAG: ABC transporter ATP-binding protein [Chloroflexi bacterium]|nr:ABC transporter ATP-binding protein [Chloroflexota bacterium]